MPSPEPHQSADASSDAEPFDVLVAGTVFLDIIFTGMAAAPVGGREILTDGMGSSPGGAANLAIAASRLGLRTSLAAAFGGDVYGEYCWSTLSDAEGVDLSHSRRFPEWHSPVTVSLAYDDDRAMVTHTHAPPADGPDLVADPPPTRSCFADMGAERQPWLDTAISRGSLVFADVGWDPTGAWDTALLRDRLEGCHAFVPNASEAMAYTGTDSPGAALEAIRDWVPLAVVTAGSGGAFAADATTGETVWVPGLSVPVLDPTGAGDVFLAALVSGTLAGWDLQERVRFANLCAALSVRDFGGALASPGWADVCDWWNGVDPSSRQARDYAFLVDVLPTVEHRVYDRALPTIGFPRPFHDHSRHGAPAVGTTSDPVPPLGQSSEESA
ncbi:carbohydrate kinase family protein [Solicola sp. PLA-1-18]|uniref:carbohydrate kinase family protein n=1 Tax=Solicola sp. PLA-1-18 TaxID=3380532 RepID=UPI003B7CF7AC